MCTLVGTVYVMAKEISKEIRGYIKTRFKLGKPAKAIFDELCVAYGHRIVSYSTVTRWYKRFKSGIESVESAPRPGRPASAIVPQIIQKVQNILKKDARLTTRQIAKAVGISTGSAFKILKRDLKVRRIAARWIPHLLNEDQKRQRVSTARKLLKLYPKFSQRTFSNLVTGDETWVHYFQPTRKSSNKIWATKQASRPSVAKRILSVKKVMYAVFFNSRGETVQVAIPRGRTVTGKVYCDIVLKKLEKRLKKRRPVVGLSGMTLLHDNAPAHKSSIATQFLKHKGVSVLPHPPYSPDLAPCDFFLFPKLKKFLEGRRYHNRNAIGSAIFQYLKTIPKKDYQGAFQNWIKRLKLCIKVNGEYFEGMK